MPRKIMKCSNCEFAYIGKEDISECEACGFHLLMPKTIYTQTELNKAVQDEREACAKMADSYSTYPDLAEAIRVRNK